MRLRPPTGDWDDARLGSAFKARAAATSTPRDLAGATSSTLRTRRAAVPGWPRRLAPLALVAVISVLGVGGGLALIGGPGGQGLVVFRDGPTPELQTLDAGTFSFEFPADWLAYAAAATGSGGSSIAVLGTQPVEPRCGDPRRVDINCVFEQPLDPGDVRVFVGSGAYRGGTILDRPDVENGTTTRLTVGGMPAILDEFDPQPNSYYNEDVSLAWAIGQPRSLSNTVRIEVRARDPGSAEARSVAQALIESFRFTPPPTPLPSDPAATPEAARLAIANQAASFRRGYVGDVDSTTVTYLECLGDEPDTTTTATVHYGPGGYLGRPVELECTWSVRAETATIWRLEATYDWSVDGRTGRYLETLWIDAAANVLASTFAGEPPPNAASPTTPGEVLGLPVIIVPDAQAIRDGGVDDRELAVRGWFSPSGPISCPAPAIWPVSPVEPNCPDQWVVLTEEPESLVTVEPNGFSGRGPTGPAIQIDLDDLDAAWQPRLPESGPAQPILVVVIGHFDDRRSRLCPDAVEDACRDRFVVDRVDWVDGTTQPLSVVDLVDGEQASAAPDIQAIVVVEAPGSPILSLAVVDGPTGIGRIEPALGTGIGGFIDRAAIWVVRVLETERVTTYLVIDGTDDAIYEMAEDRPPTLVGGQGPQPSAAPWPPVGASVIVRSQSDGSSWMEVSSRDATRWASFGS